MTTSLRRAGLLVVAAATALMTLPGATTAPADAATAEVRAGAAKTSIEPRPDDYGGTWETEGCAIAGDDITSAGDHVADFRSTWPENPNCLYMGGFGIGPANPIVDWDQEYGLWVRSFALGSGDQAVVLTIIDGAYYLGDYASFCETCGAFEIAETMGDELGLDPASFVLAASHSHTSPDFIGAWGGVPDWYFQQVEEAIRSTIREAVTSMEPATIEFGEELARDHNRDRRGTYRSGETQTLTWLRALAADGDTIATLAGYAAHPTTLGTNDGVAHPDWVGLFEQRLEERFGGVGLHFMTGLGNHSTAGGTEMGVTLADMIPAVGEASTFDRADVVVRQRFFDQPVTNAGLLGLGVPQFFDRPIQILPAAVAEGKADEAPCVSTSPLSIRTAASALAVGPLTFTAGPGELFSNLTNTIKEKGSPQVVFPLAIANDGLGYIMQEFEMDPVANQLVGFAGLPFFEYEEAYMLDRCVGDMVLETTLDLLDELAAELEPAVVSGPAPAEPSPPAPAPEPRPDTDAGPNTKSPLPVTGGGLLAISVAAMGTAVVARRRR